MVLSDDVPGVSCMMISTSAAVLSSTFLAFILPFSMAFRIESMSVAAVLPYGISRMHSVIGGFIMYVIPFNLLLDRLQNLLHVS